jgi:hypothetical protein
VDEFEAGPVAVADVLEWVDHHGQLMTWIVREMEKRQSYDTMTLDGFLMLTERVRRKVKADAAAAAARGEDQLTVRVPMSERDFRSMALLEDVLRNYTSVIEMRGVELPEPPAGALRTLEAFRRAKFVAAAAS